MGIALVSMDSFWLPWMLLWPAIYLAVLGAMSLDLFAVLLGGATALLAHGGPHLFEAWSIADVDLSLMLNRLVRNGGWDIALQKTGYITEAGQCLVMQAKVAGRKLIMVFLDSTGKLTRIADAERVRRWVESIPAPVIKAVPLASTVTDQRVLAN